MREANDKMLVLFYLETASLLIQLSIYSKSRIMQIFALFFD